MTAPIWILSFWFDEQEVIRCDSEYQVENTIYHHKYHKRRCIVVRVKECK